jgi:dipeptidyl aminopeptidase/acylaminoacyl peptidase
MTEKSQKHQVIPEDYFKLNYISEARLSPDGKQVVYGISSYNEEKDEDRTALWLLDIENGETRQLTVGTSQDYNAAWSPDGRQIAFVSNRVKPAQVFLLRLDGGEARQITDWKGTIAEGPAWSPDGMFLAVSAAQEDKRDLSKPYRVTRNIFRFDRLGYLDETLTDIYILPAKGGEMRRLTKDRTLNTAPAWSPDGQEILFLASQQPNTFEIGSILKTVDLKGNVHTIIDRCWKAAWMPDGRIAYAGVLPGTLMGQKTDLWVIKRRGGKPECRTETLQAEISGGLQGDMPVYPDGPIQITKDGHFALLRAQKGGEIGIWEIALNGEESCKPLLPGSRLDSHSAFLVGASPDRILYIGSSWNDPTNLFLTDRQGSNQRQLTHLNEDLMKDWLQPQVERLMFKGADDMEIEGFLMKPTTGEPPYPTVLYVHGGPSGAFGNAFSFDFQLLAGAGFAVMFNNPQGSTGYGSKYGLALNQRWGEIDYKDQMAGLDAAIAKNLVDPDRLGLYGLSYGGYMTCWMVTQTDRFKAAVSENPVSDLASDYGAADASVWMNLDAMGGHPHEVPENYAKASPVTFAHQCKTPTLMLQGEADYRCPALNTEQFYTMLKVNGCIVEMVRFPNSSHAASINGAPLIRRAQNDELLGWMKRYVIDVRAVISE